VRRAQQRFAIPVAAGGCRVYRQRQETATHLVPILSTHLLFAKFLAQVPLQHLIQLAMLVRIDKLLHCFQQVWDRQRQIFLQVEDVEG